ncbi:MAG: prolipoprotein diacylglyceryl transferase [Dehalococcoidia bacterium]|nr:prolipoprotein diacylglyceryl transferase [Dehalococcoidia bacterium]MDD5495022.1 prolipoprotein diacylglyceryl transferase [Dehalococcoidia bacterium]
MFEIDWNPIIFSLGTLEVRWYGLMVVLAVIAVIGIALLEARRTGFPTDVIWDVGLWAVVGGILGARLLHIIDRWEYYIYHPDQLLNFAGLAIWGAVLGAFIAILIYVYVKKISFWQLGDIIAPGAIVGQAIGRVGCLVNGCCYGLTCELPISIIYLNPNSYAPHGIPLYPTQIFHIVWNMLGFGVLWMLRKRLKPLGSLFLLWLIIFSVGDFIVHIFREGEPFLFSLPQAQVIDIAILAVGVPLFVYRIVRYRTKKPDAIAEEVNTSGQNPEG